MKKPVVDYTKFSFKRINEPEYRHVALLGGWIVYFALYFLTENLIPYEKCHVVHSVVDDMIPFCEYFVVFYTLWFLLVAGSLLYFFLYDTKSFAGMSKFIIVTQLVAMAVYIIWPSRQDLRPEVFERNNIFTWVMGIIYAFDTPTGVCPSLHVAYSLGILSTWWKKRDIKPYWKWIMLFLTIMISLSVMFVKQHSFVDVVAALPLGVLAEYIAYYKSYWKPRLHANDV